MAAPDMNANAALKIVVVEDSSFAAIVLQAQLAQLGYHNIHHETNGKDGLAAIARLQPDLVITDNRMPIMGGHKMLLRLRRSGSGTPAIMISAGEKAEDRTAALRAGAQAYLLKPADITLLAQTITNCLKQAGAETCGAAPQPTRGSTELSRPLKPASAMPN